VHGHDHLPSICVTPFLMASALAYQRKAIFPQDSNNFPGTANGKSFAHESATSNTFAPAGTESGDGSNQSSSASFALLTASCSVSPADAQPGSSGKNAAHRSVSRSCSTTNRSFMAFRITQEKPSGNPASMMRGPPVWRSSAIPDASSQKHARHRHSWLQLARCSGLWPP
jgi:hypothetical protein